MSVPVDQFRVVGVNRETGEDVSLILEAASKAAAEVKADKQGIETTHIVRIKPEDELPPDEYELFSADAAQALSSRRTENLIEEVANAVREEPAAAPAPAVERARPKPEKSMPMPEIVATLTRPAYSAPSMRREVSHGSPVSAFLFVLLVLLGLSGGAYFVLVHEPNATLAHQDELIFGEDLYVGMVPNTPPTSAAQRPNSNAFVSTKTPSRADLARSTEPPADLPRQPKADIPALVLQSVVTSHEGRFAVINGKLYKQGAELAGCKLLAVADDWVLMERLGEQFVLEIESIEDPAASR